MKKYVAIFLLLISFGLFVSCENLNTSISSENTTIESSSYSRTHSRTNSSLEESSSTQSDDTTSTTSTNSSKETSQTSTTTNDITASSTTTNTTSTTTFEEEVLSLKEILELGNNISNNTKGSDVVFEAIYAKEITDNQDKLMLFCDDESYLCVRVVGGFDDHLKNRYKNCLYHVNGTLSKNNGHVEVIYKSLENITSDKTNIPNYSKITTKMDSIGLVYEEIKKVNLDNKYSGYGSIVTFTGKVIATDRSDANSKAVLYDNKNVITVINDKKICDGENDIGSDYEITGIISVLKGSPAILLLDIKYIENTIILDYQNVLEVSPSYFSKWYHVSDKINDPSFDDFSVLYRINGYINDDDSRTTKYYFGLTDNLNDSLSDNGIKTSIKGIYMMNYQGLDDNDNRGQSEAIFTNYALETNIELYASLYQFDTNNHAWKVFIIDQSIEEVEE